MSDTPQGYAHLLEEIDELKKENAALREDAERYRWLRYRVDSMSLDPPLTVAKVMGWGLDAWSGDNLSAAIDAARGYAKNNAK
jgi:hypothetical protein